MSEDFIYDPEPQESGFINDLFEESKEDEIEYKYISVIFGDKLEEGKFRGPRYNYKTTKDLKEGQVIMVPTRYGESKAVVMSTSIVPSTIQFPLDSIKEV